MDLVCRHTLVRSGRKENVQQLWVLGKGDRVFMRYAKVEVAKFQTLNGFTVFVGKLVYI